MGFVADWWELFSTTGEKVSESEQEVLTELRLVVQNMDPYSVSPSGHYEIGFDKITGMTNYFIDWIDDRTIRVGYTDFVDFVHFEVCRESIPVKSSGFIRMMRAIQTYDATLKVMTS